VRPVCRSRTATLPLVTRVSVPSQRSETNQVVPRTVMTLLLARVRKWPWLSWPHSERGGRRRLAAGRARGQGPAQHELGHTLATGGLADFEATPVEGARLGRGARQRGLEGDGAGAGIDDRADGHRGAVRERRRVGRPRDAHEDRAARGRDGHGAPEDGRGRRRGYELCAGQWGRGGRRRHRCRRGLSPGEGRERDIVALRDASVVGGHDPRVVGRRRLEAADRGRDGDRLVALAGARGCGGGAVGERRSDLEPVRGGPGARVDGAVEECRGVRDRGRRLRLDHGRAAARERGAAPAQRADAQRDEGGEDGVACPGGHRVGVAARAR